jgi:hypothetical protein
VSKQVVLEVTSPYHLNGREVLYQPGDQFPLGADLPPDVRLAEVVAEVPDKPDKPPKPAAAAAAAPAAAAGKASAAGSPQARTH